MKFDIQAFSKAICSDKRTLEMFRNMVNYAYIRIVNYHSTESGDRERFEKEIAYFSRHFSPVTPRDLDFFFQEKKWPKEKPGLILGIYDGYRNQYDVLWPILEKYQMTGWYFIPADFPDVPAKQQQRYAESHGLSAQNVRDYPDGRISLSWEEIGRIAQNHVICCHTGSHFHLGRETADERLYQETVLAGHRLEQHIGRPVEVFSWRGGEEYAYNLKAHKFLEMGKYKYIVSDLKLEKIR
ncbi:MAG: polysaccharide deacetylase family protein [Lachnospiraceae bacterium]|nr:polysaccharide deacetylase family protein [Lachnospiraceae bacterium]